MTSLFNLGHHRGGEAIGERLIEKVQRNKLRSRPARFESYHEVRTGRT